MDPTLKMSLVFIAILTCHLISISSAIKIKITTDRYEGMMPVTFDVTCTLDPEKLDYYRTQRIVGIKVSRHGERPLAVLQSNSKILYDRLTKDSIEAEGHIDHQDPRNTIMTVTFNHAMNEDSGVYNCTLLYWSQWGYIQREEASDILTIEKINAQDVIRYLLRNVQLLRNRLSGLDDKTTFQVEKVETKLEQQANDTDSLRRQLEKDIDTLRTQHEKDIDTLKTQYVKQNEKMDALKTQHEKDIEALKTQNVKQNEEMDALKTQLETFENETTKHITKANLQSGFLVGLKIGDELLHEKTIKFRNVSLNIGNHYDNETSVYTAPWDGLYTFYLTALINQDTFCELDLQVNGRVVSRLAVIDNPRDQQSSVSIFASLKTGDAVDVHGYYVSGGKTLHAYPPPYTYFSGFLIKAT